MFIWIGMRQIFLEMNVLQGQKILKNNRMYKNYSNPPKPSTRNKPKMSQNQLNSNPIMEIAQQQPLQHQISEKQNQHEEGELMVNQDGGHFGQQVLVEGREEKILLENEGHMAHVQANKEDVDDDRVDQSQGNPHIVQVVPHIAQLASHTTQVIQTVEMSYLSTTSHEAPPQTIHQTQYANLHIQSNEVKVHEDGYNYNQHQDPQHDMPPESIQSNDFKDSTQNIKHSESHMQPIEEERVVGNDQSDALVGQTVDTQKGENDTQRGQVAANQQNMNQTQEQINDPITLQPSHPTLPPPSTQRPPIEPPIPSPHNMYVRTILNAPIIPSSQPTNEALQEIYSELKTQFPECLPEQIILLLYNNLIKLPREEMLEEEGTQFDDSVKFDGGHRYWAEISSTPGNNPNNKVDLSSLELRKQMIKVYVTKGYGLKVFQEHMHALNPQAPEIDKEKFKKHFIEIYKIAMRKVEEFLTNKADLQFEPLRKEEYQKPLSDVINCRKHYSSQFCEVYYRILQATFDTAYQNVPSESEVAFFYRTIVEKLRGVPLNMVKKLHQPQEEKDTEIWTEEFQFYFIKLYIVAKNIAQAKFKLVDKYPQCEGFITDQKLCEKIESAIRQATNWLSIQNTNCGNPISFVPSDIDRKFIMRAPELQETRIKLLKVYVKKPTDAQVLANIVSFVHQELRSKYEKERIPTEVIQRSTIRQLPRAIQQTGLENMLKNQIMRTS